MGQRSVLGLRCLRHPDLSVLLLLLLMMLLMLLFPPCLLPLRLLFRQVLSSVLSSGDELEAQEMLESLVQLADVSPLFFRTNVVSTNNVLTLCVEAPRVCNNEGWWRDISYLCCCRRAGLHPRSPSSRAVSYLTH